MSQRTVTLKKLKETKRTVKFEEVDSGGTAVPQDEGNLGVVYIQKRAFGSSDTFPEEVNLTLEWAD
jgi:hypothetical protein